MNDTPRGQRPGSAKRARWFVRRFLNEARSDLVVALDRDPSARSRLEVALLYPGVHALWAHRVSHALWSNRALLAARAVSQTARLATGVEIHPAASIGTGAFISHGAGVVIDESVVVGSNVTIGPGAKLLGNIQIGAWSRIGAGAVVEQSVGWGSTVAVAPSHVTSS